MITSAERPRDILQERIEAGINADLILEDTARAVASARAEAMRRGDVHEELVIERSIHAVTGTSSGAGFIEKLKQIVGRELNLFVTPLGSPVVTGDQA